MIDKIAFERKIIRLGSKMLFIDKLPLESVSELKRELLQYTCIVRIAQIDPY